MSLRTRSKPRPRRGFKSSFWGSAMRTRHRCAASHESFPPLTPNPSPAEGRGGPIIQDSFQEHDVPRATFLFREADGDRESLGLGLYASACLLFRGACLRRANAGAHFGRRRSFSRGSEKRRLVAGNAFGKALLFSGRL